MNKKKIEALKILANNNIFKVLDSLGVEYTERYQYLNGVCPAHRGGNPTAFSWLVDKGIWQCFTNGCQDKFGSDIYGLICGVRNCKFGAAIDYLETLFRLSNIKVSITDEAIANRKFASKINSMKKDSMVYPEESLKKLIYHEYLEGRGYPRELISSYHIGVTEDNYKEMSRRVIFPVRSIDGDIVGFSGRTLITDHKPKWYHSKGFNKSHHLFNIDRAAKHILESGEVIVTEGPLDVLRLEQIGIHNSVALMGIKISNKQIALLVEAGASKLRICLDNDKAGITGTNDMKKVASSYFSIQDIKLPEGKDVGDLTPEEAKGIFLHECSV